MESTQYWFVNIGGNNQGPLKESDLIKAYRDGKIDDMTPVWTDGLADWVAFSRSSLFEKAQVQPPKFDAEKFAQTDEKKFSIDLLNESGETTQVSEPSAPAESKTEPVSEQAPPPEATLSPEPVHYVGFWMRYLAYALDSLILFFIEHMVTVVFPLRIVDGAWNLYYGWWLRTTVLGFLYFGVLQPKMQGTIGKKALGIVVVDEKFKPMDIGTGILRYILFVIFNIPLCIGAIWAAFDSRKQGLHDKLAKTFVIRTRDLK
jgi:uncharacterized RDD family membrane protein YckC